MSQGTLLSFPYHFFPLFGQGKEDKLVKVIKLFHFFLNPVFNLVMVEFQGLTFFYFIEIFSKCYDILSFLNLRNDLTSLSKPHLVVVV